MGKLSLQVQMSVDGCIAGRNGEMDWMIWNWDDALKNYVGGIAPAAGTILLGRKMTDGFISTWSAIRNNPGDPEQAFAQRMMDTPKVVFSRTMTESPWENTVIAAGDVAAAVSDIKSRDEKEVMAYGGANFAVSLINSGLIDEYHLFVNPVLLGEGLSIFSALNTRTKLRLKQSIRFDCGIVLLNYVPEQA